MTGATGERIPWGPGQVLVLLRPAVVTGVVMSADVKEEDVPAHIGVTPDAWRQYLAYHRVSGAMVNRAFADLTNGWETFRQMRAVCVPEIPATVEAECDETLAEANIPFQRILLNEPSPDGRGLRVIREVEARVLGKVGEVKL